MSRCCLPWLAAALVLCGCAVVACGADEPCVLIEVRWQGYRVPDELDTLHFALSDGDGLLVERSLAIPASAPPATLQLCQGPRTPEQLQLVVHGIHAGQSVARAGPVPIDFGDAGETIPVQLPAP